MLIIKRQSKKQTIFMQTQIDKVKKYYDSTVIDYKILWTGSKDLAMHFGYYDKDAKTHEESLLKMNQVLAQHASISRKDRVLDAGCGYGGSAIWLAKNIGCEVVGVTVVPYQIQEAKKFAIKYKISNRVRFHLEDYTHTSFANNSFSIIWGLESIVHAQNKKDFIKEADRLLKNKGRILISEFMLRENPKLSNGEENIILPWLKGWAMPSLLTAGEYESHLAHAGFQKIQVHDLTANVKPSLDRLGKFAIFGFPMAKVLRKLGILSKEHYGNVEASFYQNKAFNLGLWKYIVIIAQKS